MRQVVYGQEVEVLKKHDSGAPIDKYTIRTNHTLDMFVRVKGKETKNVCPFDKGITLISDKCRQCKYNSRKHYNGILPSFTRECARFDATQICVEGDCWSNVNGAVVASEETLRLMEEYANRIIHE